MSAVPRRVEREERNCENETDQRNPLIGGQREVRLPQVALLHSKEPNRVLRRRRLRQQRWKVCKRSGLLVCLYKIVVGYLFKYI